MTREELKGRFSKFWNTAFEVPVIKLRVAAVVMAAMVSIGLTWKWPGHNELSHILSYGAFVVISLFAAQWSLLAILYFILTTLWAFTAATEPRPSSRARTSLWIVFILRHVIHLEALIPFFILTFIWFHSLAFSIPVAVLIAAFGPVLLEGIRGREAFYHDDALSRVDWQRKWAQPSRASVLTLSGLVLVSVSAPGQFSAIAPVVVVVIAAMICRWLIVWLLLKNEERTYIVPKGIVLRARWRVWVTQVLSIAIVVLLLLRWLGPSSRAKSQDVAGRRYAGDSVPIGGTSVASLFLISDSQFHELRGERNGGQLDMIDDLVPVAVRPVELDLLSGATLAHFARIYHELHKENPSLMWAHLGDFGDLSCLSELERMGQYVQFYGLDNMAAVVPGNHDSSFVGNFIWHPSWKQACGPSPILRKMESDNILGSWERTEPQKHTLPKTWLPRVTPIGTGDRAVRGIFLDSSDYTGYNLGIAGLQGSISIPQASKIIDQVSGKFKVVLFMHHPYDDLSDLGKWNIWRIAEHLGERLLAIVSAHTHLVGARSHVLAGRCIPELVVGSTTDPPQEAAILDNFEESDRYLIRLRTIPAVSRSRFSDPHGFRDSHSNSSPYIYGYDCERAFNRLQHNSSSACSDLFKQEDPPEHVCRGEMPEEGRPGQPVEVKCKQQWRAKRLLDCIIGEQVPAQPLDKNIDLWTRLDPQIIRAFQRPADSDPVNSEGLVCMSWAASILQGHKHDFRNFQDALRFALEDSVTYGSKDIVVASGDCHAGEVPGARLTAPR